jgi:uncharacterized protein YbaA (DUF1428 family)
MKPYVDGYVLPIPKDKLADYRRLAQKAAKIWREHGALEYRECVAEDDNAPEMVPFSKGAKAKPGEVVIFAYVLFKSRKHRDQVNAKVMADPRLANLSHDNVPFDCKRMMWGGFNTLVSA